MMKRYFLITGVLVITFGCSSTNQQEVEMETTTTKEGISLRTDSELDISSLEISEDTLNKYGKPMPYILIIDDYSSVSTFNPHDLISNQ